MIIFPLISKFREDLNKIKTNLTKVVNSGYQTVENYMLKHKCTPKPKKDV